MFVVGCQRSGTTLLRAMLDAHPQLAVPPESHFLVPLAEEAWSKTRFLELLAGHRRFARWQLPVDDVAAALDEHAVDNLADAVRVLYRTYARRAGKPRWADKTPDYVRHIGLVASLLEEARFVHLVRDGRDVALSWVEADFGPDSVTEAARRWRQDVRAAKRAGRALPGRYLEVRYETLVTRPRWLLRRICGFAELRFDEQMLRYSDRADGIIAGALAPEAHQRLREPLRAGVRDWRTQMGEEDVLAFQRVAGPLLRRLGYPLA